MKTRIQNGSFLLNNNIPWTIRAVKMITKEEGISALYKGYVPKVLRLGPGGGILLVVFDAVMSILKTF